MEIHHDKMREAAGTQETGYRKIYENDRFIMYGDGAGPLSATRMTFNLKATGDQIEVVGKGIMVISKNMLVHGWRFAEDLFDDSGLRQIVADDLGADFTYMEA